MHSCVLCIGVGSSRWPTSVMSPEKQLAVFYDKPTVTSSINMESIMENAIEHVASPRRPLLKFSDCKSLLPCCFLHLADPLSGLLNSRKQLGEPILHRRPGAIVPPSHHLGERV